LTIVSQIKKDKLGQPVGVIARPSHHQVDDLVDDDFSHRVVNIAPKHQRIVEEMRNASPQCAPVRYGPSQTASMLTFRPRRPI
jgi:hypothetical protein